ncbi:MAG: YgcG family protein [Gammaproteobacteria bacterium]|nr:YgcG family protein [Gammaproteobacteria bacterium]
MIRRLFLLPVLLLVPLLALAELAVPALQARVTDLSGTLDAAQVAALEAKLAAFEQRKGAQVAVLLVASTQPETIEQYGIRVAEAWQLGRRGIDDGALLLVARDDRSLRIEVGYGLEGVLPDAIARRIIDEAIVPHFRRDDYYGGIDAGIDRMLAVIDGEPLPAPSRQRATGSFDDLVSALPLLFIFSFVFGNALKRSLGQLPGSLAAGALIGGLAWLILGVIVWASLAAVAAFLLSLFSRTAAGGWASRGGSGMGGISGGRSGGGGFRGGGGSFGGGGSSGRW